MVSEAELVTLRMKASVSGMSMVDLVGIPELNLQLREPCPGSDGILLHDKARMPIVNATAKG